MSELLMQSIGIVERKEGRALTIKTKTSTPSQIPTNSPLGQFLKSLPSSAYANESPKTSMETYTPTESPAGMERKGQQSSTASIPTSIPALFALSNPITLPSDGHGVNGVYASSISNNPVSNSSGHNSNKTKNKKKRRVSELVVDTIPLNDVRRNYPRLLEMIFNRCQAEDCYNKLLTMCTTGPQGLDDAFTLIISAFEKENEFGPVYSEIHSIDAASRYLSTVFYAIPDSIFVIVDCKFYKRAPGGESEIHCNFSFSGSKVYKMVVEDCDESYDMGSAVLGLQTLAQVAMEREYLAQEELEEGEIANETVPQYEKSKPSTTSSNDSESTTSPAITSYFNADKKKIFVVGETEFCTNISQGDDNFPPPAYDQLMIGTKKTKFRVGDRLPASRSFSTNVRKWHPNQVDLLKVETMDKLNKLKQNLEWEIK